MKHLIMGTAGHIDHGKTALIKALTDIECDTHPEEKARGITIHLGFAHLDFDDGSSIGIIDVPGHIDFINTMVAGAYGVDLALLVVAADSGVMPQTHEHLHILDILGVRAGVIALTKSDLVDCELLEMAEAEIREAVQGTFLESSPIIPVSAVTREGIPQLIHAIARECNLVPRRRQGNMFRMFIDRIFSVAGYGTVVTGSVLGGSVQTGELVYLLPGARHLRVRKMERHGVEVQTASDGDRISMNLAGLRRDEFTRGMMLAGRAFKPTAMFDASIRLFQNKKDLRLWHNATALIGTFHAPARIHLIDHDTLPSGQTAIVQVHLQKSCMAMRGDKFILRSHAGDQTLGGGEIIDAYPLHHRRRPPSLVQQLRDLARGRLEDAIATHVRKAFGPVPCAGISKLLDVPKEHLCDELFASLPPDIVWLGGIRNGCLMLQPYKEKLECLILRRVHAHHARNPLDARGESFEELAGLPGIARNGDTDLALELILGALVRQGDLKQVAGTWAEPGHSVRLAPADMRQIRLIEEYCRDSGLHTPLLSELEPFAAAHGIPRQKLHQILRLLSSQGALVPIEGNYLHASIVELYRGVLIDHLEANPGGITVAGFRDLIGGNRKICLLLLGIYDREGITERRGDERVLAAKGAGYLRRARANAYSTLQLEAAQQ